MIEFLSLLFLLAVFGLCAKTMFNSRKPDTCKVIPFRTYYRIEWLRKRRLSKIKSRGRY